MYDVKHHMKQVKLKDVQENFEQIFDVVLVRVRPLIILKESGNAILVSEEVWRGMTETLNLVSVPGMRATSFVKSFVEDRVLKLKQQLIGPLTPNKWDKVY